MMLQIHCIPAFSDNYFWLIQPDQHLPDVYIVDPGDVLPVEDALNKRHLVLKGILLTHHHHDHIDGALALANKFQAPIFGPQSSRMPQVTHVLAKGDTLAIGRLTAQILEIPGHTLDHIGYFLAAEEPPRLFSGDTIFAAGCGRLFDGTAMQLFDSLSKISKLPDNTLIYAAHEYTAANLRFAQYIEPENLDITARIQQVSDLRNQGIPTLPTKLSIEKRTNPFLRCHLNAIHVRAEAIADQKITDAATVFTYLRLAKDKF